MRTETRLKKLSLVEARRKEYEQRVQALAVELAQFNGDEADSPHGYETPRVAALPAISSASGSASHRSAASGGGTHRSSSSTTVRGSQRKPTASLSAYMLPARSRVGHNGRHRPTERDRSPSLKAVHSRRVEERTPEMQFSPEEATTPDMPEAAANAIEEAAAAKAAQAEAAAKAADDAAAALRRMEGAKAAEDPPADADAAE